MTDLPIIGTLPPAPPECSMYFWVRFFANADPTIGDEWYNWKALENLPPCGHFDFAQGGSLSFRFAPSTRDFEVVELPILAVLEMMEADQRFNLNPARWHRVKNQIHIGSIEYPWVTANRSGHPSLMDGRHRLVAMMKFLGLSHAPFVVESKHVEAVKRYFLGN